MAILLLLAALILIVGLQLTGVVSGNPDPELVTLTEQVTALEERLANLEEAVQDPGSDSQRGSVDQEPGEQTPSPTRLPGTSTPAQGPDPTIDPTIAAKLTRGQVNLVDFFIGTASFRSRAFTMESSPWAIIWNLSGEDPDTMLKIFVYRVDIDTPLKLAVDTAGKGNSTAYILEAGAFFLDIQASGNWNILVADIQ